MARIRLEGIGKHFGDVQVVRDLDLTIEDKEFFTFVGPSGCGKSTILNMIAGLEAITRGTLFFDDEMVNMRPAGQRDVAMVFQSYALYPHMTVYENLGFPLTVKKMPKPTVDERVRAVATLLDLDGLLQRKPAALSGGQRQRVALGRALVRTPRVFLMDEPLSNLDARLRVEMRAELKRLHSKYQVTTVYVTHDQEEAMVLSDRIAVLNHGIVQQCGTPGEVYHQPENMFVAGFIGSPVMNFVDSTVLRDVSWAAPLLAQTQDEEVVVGVRPKDISVGIQQTDTSLQAQVSLLEPTGGDIWVDGVWQDTAIKGRLNPDSAIKPGQTAFFHIPVDKCHIFAKNDGHRLI